MSETVAQREMTGGGRVEIDTSAPFESVKEAVSLFGGSAAWKPPAKLPSTTAFVLQHDHLEELDVAKVEEQTAQLEKDLIVKERETLDVLKELESTKRTAEELKLKLQKEQSDVTPTPNLAPENINLNRTIETGKQRPVSLDISLDSGFTPNAPLPGLILKELQQAKVNLNRTTDDLAGIRTSVESLNKKLEKEKHSLEKTRERLASNCAKILSLEEELYQTRLKLELATEGDGKDHEKPINVSKELQELTMETEKFKKIADAARSEVSKTVAEIEQTKTSTRTAEIRWLAAKKMEGAARAAEAVALAEMKAFASTENLNTCSLQKPEGVTISYEEYMMLNQRAREADEQSKKKIETIMVQVYEAEESKRAILRQVEEVSEEVKKSRKALEEALVRVESANQGKLAVEEALRKWRSEHGQRRRSVHNSTKFKNSYPSHHRRSSRLLDVNGASLDADGLNRILKPTLSIGQILSRKLMSPEESDISERKNEKRKVSLGQMLSKRNGALSPPGESVTYKQFSAKRKRFGFARISQLLAKENMKKKKKQIAKTDEENADNMKW